MVLRRFKILKRRTFDLRDSVVMPTIKRKASNSWSAVQDTFFSTKDIFERHRVVFTISTSLASILTAWAGYSLRYYHQSNVEKRLESIEQVMKNSYDVERKEIKQIINSGNVSTAAFMATSCTTFAIGYCLGWRGGSWYTNRKLRREQLRALGQMKPNKWKLMRKPLIQSKIFRSLRNIHEKTSTPISVDAGAVEKISSSSSSRL
ncbi:hypothetical protein ZOSMA_223G00260 [Zostera marina]|uniref:Triacylglycerol lipase n=1 Tax=Zostera marina TaxID=29655 RepID=A0A0K9PJ83_ZOSMR|nr:hypothetical protein ZOSMA_223G00260 [Zostera marina]